MTTLSEFLVGLGWEPNRSGQLEFEKSIQSATLKAKLLADGLEELARKVIDSVSGIADNFDKLYFQAQRTNTAASTISDFVQVMSQAGVSAGAAEGSVKNMTDKIRAGHIAVQDLNRMGWGLNPLTHQWEIQRQYVTNMASLSDAMLASGANLIGMDINVALALRRMGGTFVDETDKLVAFRKRLGFDPAQAQADGNKLASIWRDTDRMTTTIGDKIRLGLVDALVGPVSLFNKFLNEHAEEIGADIKIIMDALLKMTTAWSADLEKWIKDPDALAGFRSNMHEIATDIGDMASAFSNFIKDIIWLGREGSKIVDILNHLTGQKESGTGWNDLKEGLGPGGTLDQSLGISPEDKRSPWERFAPKWAGGKDAPNVSTGSGTVARGNLAANQREAYQAAKAEGLSDTAARAVVANLSGESLATPSDRHWDRSHYSQGIASWDPQRVAAIRAQFGKDPMEMSVAEQTKAHIWEMKNNPRFAPTWAALQGTDAGEMIDKLVRNYEAPANPEADISKRAGFYRGLGNLDAPASNSTSLNTTDYGNLRLTKDAASGGPANRGLVALAHHIQDTEDVTQFHAFSDEYHQGANPRSMHNRGLAFDVSTKSRDYESARERTRRYLVNLGLVEGDMGGRGGDFAIEPGTTDHLHVQFNSAAAGQRYLELTGGASTMAARAAPAHPHTATPPASHWDALNAWKQGGPLSSNLLGGVKPTLGGAAPPPSATTVHAPMETDIHVHGAGGEAQTPEMVAAHITHDPADLTRNLQGATH